jgi:hypothetical protein
MNSILGPRSTATVNSTRRDYVTEFDMLRGILRTTDPVLGLALVGGVLWLAGRLLR